MKIVDIYGHRIGKAVTRNIEFCLEKANGIDPNENEDLKKLVKSCSPIGYSEKIFIETFSDGFIVLDEDGVIVLKIFL